MAWPVAESGSSHSNLGKRTSKRRKAPKSLWAGHDREKAWSFYCPLCRTSRRLTFKPRGFSGLAATKHAAQVGLTAAFFTVITWSWFNWKGIISFIPIWIASEIIYRIKLRAALACPHCGFDPHLYTIDVNLARKEIENHFRKKFSEKSIPYPEKSP